jgi:ABC-type nickel/cobalt efflux system permease component RcnA
VRVPGGITDDVASILSVRDLSPLAIVTTLALAAALGAAHALSPGHGKTVMAAYLVGSRGTARHAVALGLLVTMSHTAGVLVLALIVLSATTMIAPERLVPALVIGSGALFVAMGCWMLRDQVRLRAARRVHDHEQADRHDPGHGHPADHPHPHGHEHRRDEEHSHGGIRHRHLPADARDLTWRRLVVLGLAGGLVPSISALILLLGSLAAGRPAYGLVLVVAFGGGMAAVLGGIGFALVYARGLVERRTGHTRFAGALEVLPIAASVLVIAAGLWVTGSSLLGIAI